MSNSRRRFRQGKNTGNCPVVRNDKGSTSRVRAASTAPPLSSLISRRQALSLGLTTGLGGAVTACKPAALSLTEEARMPPVELPAEYRQQVVIRWGDPLWRNVPSVPPASLDAEQAAGCFGYNNDYLVFLPLPFGSDSSGHGLLVANHEYPIPHLMFRGIVEAEVPEGLSDQQIAATLEAVGMSVVEILKDENGDWQVVEDSPWNRRITASTPIRLSGPAAGNDRLKTRADPTGRLVLGTHDNCNGGVTPWGTVLSGEEGSQDFFGGDIQDSPDAGLLARYHYDDIKPTGEFGWPGHDQRFDIASEPNEPNRFEWVVELDPFDPDALPVKRTALGRFAHEGAHCIQAPDGRLVVYMGDDWEFEYCYRFVSDRKVDLQDRTANKDLLDAGELSVARFDADGTLSWLPLVFGQGPLTEQNGFRSQGDVLVQTRLAADLLGATPMDSPEGYMPDPRSGRVYIALTGNDERSASRIDAANPRGPNMSGHLLELTPPDFGQGADHSASRFDWQVRLVCDEDPNRARGFHPDTPPDGYFVAPDNINFDPRGRLWVCSDGPNSDGEDGLWTMATTGPQAWLSRRVFRSPRGAECCGPAFTPDGSTMFVAIQHPAENEDHISPDRGYWPDFRKGEAPRPAVIAVAMQDGEESWP